MEILANEVTHILLVESVRTVSVILLSMSFLHGYYSSWSSLLAPTVQSVDSGAMGQRWCQILPVSQGRLHPTPLWGVGKTHPYRLWQSSPASKWVRLVVPCCSPCCSRQIHKARR